MNSLDETLNKAMVDYVTEELSKTLKRQAKTPKLSDPITRELMVGEIQRILMPTLRVEGIEPTQENLDESRLRFKIVETVPYTVTVNIDVGKSADE